MLGAVYKWGVVNPDLLGYRLEVVAPWLVLREDARLVSPVDQLKIVLLLLLRELEAFEQLDLGKRRPVIDNLEEVVPLLEFHESLCVQVNQVKFLLIGLSFSE